MKTRIWITCFAALLLFSCSGTKGLQEGDVLYTGSSIKINKITEGEEWSMKYNGRKITRLYWDLWDTPNGSLFGLPNFRLIPFRLYIYNWFYTEREGTFGSWMMKNFGEAPATINRVAPDLKVLKGINIYENYGHFGTKGSYDLNYSKSGKRAYIHYTFLIPEAFSYRHLMFSADTTLVHLSAALRDYPQRSLLQPGDEFDLDKIRNEKTNLWNYLQNEGFYHLEEEDIVIDADTTAGHRQLDMKYSIPVSGTPIVDQRAIVDSLVIVINGEKQQDDSGDYFRWSTGRLRRNMFEELVPIAPGDTFSLAATRASVRNLNDLGIFANPRINYTIVPLDSTRLDGHILMDPLDATTIGFNIDGNYRNTGYLGAAVGFNMMQRNVFGGAENLTVNGDFYYDFPIGVFKERISNSSGFSLRTQMSSPLLHSPFHFIRGYEALPRKFVSAYFNYNDRKDYFTLYGITLSGGFAWPSGPNTTQRLELANLTYSDIYNTTLRFDSIAAENPSIRNSLVDQFILGTGYSIRYDRSKLGDRKFGLYAEGGIELAGNLLSATNAIFNSGSEGTNTFLGAEYSQYVLFSYDVRGYWRSGTRNLMVARHHAGYGFAFGNSAQMPFIKQFFIGGSNSLRPINARSVGPGRYLELDQGEVNQVGDILMEWNLEYRISLGTIVNFALWSDMGNIFLFNEDPNRPGSGIRWGKVFEDSYLTAGAGLRLDLRFLILRLDYGAVLYLPILENGQRWIWQNKLPLHGPVIGFGYPF